MSRQERYENLYRAVEVDMLNLGLLKESLTELCSVTLDRKGNENLVHVDFLLEPSLEAKTELQRSFDKRAKEHGFELHYINVSGKMY